MVVKAIGCPFVFSTWQLVTETVGNAVARRMGVLTPEPGIVWISPSVANLINRSLPPAENPTAIQPGFAAGCEYLPRMVPFTPGQMLGPEVRAQAAKLFVCDLLSQNVDRRRDRVNCGLTKNGLVAFDFELSFAHLFVHLLGKTGEPWEPSKTGIARNHLFLSIVKDHPASLELINSTLASLTPAWWGELVASLPPEWQPESAKLGQYLRSVTDHSEDFCRDIVTRCLI